MSRNRDDGTESFGSDSFLDVVSNIVGIMIVLVMVAGTRIGQLAAENHGSHAEAKRIDEAKHAEKSAELRGTASKLAEDINAMARQAHGLDRRTAVATREREELGTLIRTVELQLDAFRQNISDSDRRVFDLGGELASARAKLDELSRQQLSELSAPPVEVKIVTYPTPIGKTVFSREEHYRLLNGRLVRIPFDELKEALLDEKRQLIWKLKDLPEVSGAVGPIDDFRLRYHIVRTATGGGSVTSAEYVPTATKLGVPLAAALVPNSEFRRYLARLDKNSATITVWIYPDSFAEFRTLRQELYKLGFAVAGRPQDKDSQIGFSPRGSRSSAQ
jgi:hypothetical protein